MRTSAQTIPRTTYSTVPANSEVDEEAGEGEHDDEADDLSGALAESDERDRDAAKARGKVMEKTTRTLVSLGDCKHTVYRRWPFATEDGSRRMAALRWRCSEEPAETNMESRLR